MPKEITIEKSLIRNLRDLGHKIRFNFEGKISQKRILIILNENGKMTQRELTEKLKVQPGSASEIIGKLEMAGLIERTSSAIDRRTANIILTKEGIKEAKEALDSITAKEKEMFKVLSKEEKEELLRILEKLNDNWDIPVYQRRRRR